MVGMGSDNARGTFDNVRVQILPPQITLDSNADLTTGSGPLDTPMSGNWSSSGSGQSGAPGTSPTGAVIPVALPDDVTRLASTSWLRLTTTLRLTTAGAIAGIVFDVYERATTSSSPLSTSPASALCSGTTIRACGFVVDAVFAPGARRRHHLHPRRAAQGRLGQRRAQRPVHGQHRLQRRRRPTAASAARPCCAAPRRSRPCASAPTTRSSRAPPPPPDPGELPTAVIDDVTVVEGTSGTRTVTLTVTLSAPPAAGTVIRIPWSTADLSATFGQDYALASGILQFSAGVTQQQIVITILGDVAVEGEEASPSN